MALDLVILAVGRLKDAEADLCARYLTRIDGVGRQVGIGGICQIELAEARGGDAAQRQRREADAMLQKLTPNARLIALDEHGRVTNSQTFSDLLAGERDSGASQLVFALGGADGHGEALLSRASHKLSLSRLTLPHGLARVVLAEQIYRGLTILGGHPYHRE